MCSADVLATQRAWISLGNVSAVSCTNDILACCLGSNAKPFAWL